MNKKSNQPLNLNGPKLLQHRFYLIKIKSIQQIQNPLLNELQRQVKQLQIRKSQQKSKRQGSYPNLRIKFQIGNRSSQSQIIKLQKSIKSQVQTKKNQKKSKKTKKHSQYISSDLHIFPFQKQQVMSVMVTNQKHQKSYGCGYSLVPLTPFMKLPYTKHQIQINMVYQECNKKIDPKCVAKLTIEFQFLYNFQGRLFIQPVQAILTRNIADLGQMTPKIKFYINGKPQNQQVQTETIEQGGIKPRWKSYNSSDFCVFNFKVDSVFDDVHMDMRYQNPFFPFVQVLNLGQTKIDLQEQNVFKNSFSYNQFMADMIIAVNKKQKQEQTKQKQLLKNMQQNHAKSQDFKKMKVKLEKYEKQQSQKRQIMSRIRESKLRSQMIEKTIQKNIILSSKNQPKELEQMAQKIYNDNLDEQKRNNLQQKANNFIIQQRLQTKTNQNPVNSLKHRIHKLLINQFQKFTKFVQSKMQQSTIPLIHQTLDFNTGKLERQKQVGKLTVRYVFLYNFQTAPDKQEIQV